MRFTGIITAVAAAALAITPAFAAKCSTAPGATDAEQLEAIKDFANSFLVIKNIQKGFDDWIPGTYINHNPNAQSGRENALNALRPFVSNPSLQFTVAQVFAGQGYGLIHYRARIPGQLDMAIMDRFRFEGTCIVEHWDVGQTITGREPNPIAFF
ncbi:hypothetical protein NLJ89_g4314 [Agrocybe chaxingu]|uniref:SnoaL-like domain-containing protein n=1 Tax=Agrocybe chaxingu TaxID=84603 RepID=A0A9W8MXT6_9AGAR|nr:hypothetical protein NLJ89_g4314 [Agrocybe chaxingu]